MLTYIHKATFGKYGQKRVGMAFRRKIQPKVKIKGLFCIESYLNIHKVSIFIPCTNVSSG